MATETLRITVLCHCGLEDDLDTLGDYYLRLRGKLVWGAGGQPPDTVVDVHFEGVWAQHFSALQPNDLFMAQNSFEALGEGGQPIWMVTTGVAQVAVARGAVGGGYFNEVEANLQNPDWIPPDWFRLPTSTHVVRGQYFYRRMSSLHQRRENNVFGVLWENARPGVVLNNHAHTSSYCRNLVLVDKSMINCPCSTWTTDPLLPECSLQVKRTTGVGRLQSLPYLCVGAVVRAHRMETMRKFPKYFNLWYRRYSSIAYFDLADVQAVPAAAQCYLQPVDEDHGPTISNRDLSEVRELSLWIRRRLENETISAYLRTLADVPTANDSDDLVVEVLATHPQRKEFLATDWSPGTRPVRIRCTEPDLGPSYTTTNTSTWLLANMQQGHWLKLRYVRTQPSSSALTYADPGGVDPHLYVQASMVTRVPKWCLDVVTRAGGRTDDRSNDFETDVVAFRSLPPPNSSHRRAPLLALPAPPAPADARPAAGAEDAEAGRDGQELRLHPNRRGRLTTSYGGEAEAHSISAALHPEAESNLLLKSFTVRGICGFQGGSTFLTSLNVEELLCAVCTTCGHRHSVEAGRAATPGADAEGAAATRRRVQLSCGHDFFAWRFEGSLKIESEDSSDQLVVAFSEENPGLLDAHPRDAAVDEDVREAAQAKLLALFRWQPGERSEHVMAVVRSGSGSGGGDLEGSWNLEDTKIELCYAAS